MLLSRYEKKLYAVIRMTAGFSLFYHGRNILLHFSAPLTEIPYIIYYASAIQLLGGFLVAVGFWTRGAAFIVSLEMVYAWFNMHGVNSTWLIEKNSETVILYCLLFLSIAIAGSGILSVDYYRKNRN